MNACWILLGGILMFSTYTDGIRQNTLLPITKPDGEVEQIAVDMLKEFEGFISTPKWDVNAYRVGYGSDTITQKDGVIVKVRPGMSVTKEEAEKDLFRRVKEFQSVVEKEVPSSRLLDPKTQAALISIAYNYGNLPDNVAAAVNTQDKEAIARAVEELKSHDNGINARRRKAEAQAIRQ